MTKIFYAVQATGNGHISRAKQLYPALVGQGEVDIFLSGSNSHLDIGIPVKYQSSGISLFFKACGDIDKKRTVFKNDYVSCIKDIKNLPLEDYDVIINDFDFITAYAAKVKGLKSVQFGHQASFKSKQTPRPEKKSTLGEQILKNYAPATDYVGLHFKSYDSFIKTPVIKKEIIDGAAVDHGHITVYLPSIDPICLRTLFYELKDIHFHWFLGGIKEVKQDKNITLYPISNDGFTKSLLSCHGVITGGGFETPAEAMYLGKKLICIPIANHYEQQCNAAAAKDMGAIVWDHLDDPQASELIRNWYACDQDLDTIIPNDIDQTIQEIMDIF